MNNRQAVALRRRAPLPPAPSRLAEYVAGAVVADRHTVAAALILRVDADDVADPGAVDSKRVPVDVVQGVGFLVVVRVERLVALSVPQLCLLGGHLLFGAGEQAARGTPRQGDPLVVRATVEPGVLRRLPLILQVCDEVAFDARRTLRHPRSGISGVRRDRLVA